MNINFDNMAEKIFDNFKKITPALIAVSILTSFILFLPKGILAKMSLDELPVLWYRIIGLAFLFSIALIITIIIMSMFSFIGKYLRNKKIREELKKKIQNLSYRQDEILIKLLHSEDKTIELDITSGDTVYLLNNSFLYRPEQTLSYGLDGSMYAKYTPQPWLMELYNENPELFN